MQRTRHELVAARLEKAGRGRAIGATMLGRERPSEIHMVRYQLTAVVWEEDGVYVSRCLELEVASCGDTPKEALAMLREAIDLHLENTGAYGISHSPTLKLQRNPEALRRRSVLYASGCVCG